MKQNEDTSEEIEVKINVIEEKLEKMDEHTCMSERISIDREHLEGCSAAGRVRRDACSSKLEDDEMTRVEAS